MSLVTGLMDALSMAFGMAWEILWALILGFALSAAVQAVVSKAEMTRLLPTTPPAPSGWRAAWAQLARRAPTPR
jgi:uncharacterized membrane protein YraQ (UPF0718 family)